MRICTHDLAERESACADGFCPICSADRIRELEAERDAAVKLSRCECGPEELCANLVKAHARAEAAEARLRAVAGWADDAALRWKRYCAGVLSDEK